MRPLLGSVFGVKRSSLGDKNNFVFIYEIDIHWLIYGKIVTHYIMSANKCSYDAFLTNHIFTLENA